MNADYADKMDLKKGQKKRLFFRAKGLFFLPKILVF
jgi:hypothetical protein